MLIYVTVHRMIAKQATLYFISLTLIIIQMLTLRNGACYLILNLVCVFVL